MLTLKPCDASLFVANQIPAMLAYWTRDLKCAFSNAAYRKFFGRAPEEMHGMAMQELLGPLFELNLPYILGALRGEQQSFERRIPLPEGGYRDTVANYVPDVHAGEVRGFSVHVADVTVLREREAALERVIRERDEARAELDTLRDLVTICAWCKSIHPNYGPWQSAEDYIHHQLGVNFTHGICPKCFNAQTDHSVPHDPKEPA